MKKEYDFANMVGRMNPYSNQSCLKLIKKTNESNAGITLGEPDGAVISESSLQAVIRPRFLASQESHS